MNDLSIEKSIWKFEIDIDPTGKSFISIPKEGEILSFQFQNNKPMIWVLVNPKNETERRCFELYCTGQKIFYNMGVERKFIGTSQAFNGTLVMHLFERKL